MSIRLMSEVWRTKLPTVEKMVLLVIADHANDEGTEAWPSQATIANKASVSVRTVQRAVNSLVSGGFLRLEKHAGGSANCREDRRPHRYTMILSALRGDATTTRTLRGDGDNADGATITPTTGRLSSPKNLPLEPSLETPVAVVVANSEFAIFWGVYPTKVGKQAAMKAWDRAIQNADSATIVEGARRYADDPNRHPSYTAHPSTWLNAGRWADDPLPPRELNPAEKKAQEAFQAALRADLERTRSAELSRQDEEARARAVPMPDNIKDALRKVLGSR
jgi:hypothetical protein